MSMGYNSINELLACINTHKTNRTKHTDEIFTERIASFYRDAIRRDNIEIKLLCHQFVIKYKYDKEWDNKYHSPSFTSIYELKKYNPFDSRGSWIGGPVKTKFVPKSNSPYSSFMSDEEKAEDEKRFIEYLTMILNSVFPFYFGSDIYKLLFIYSFIKEYSYELFNKKVTKISKDKFYKVRSHVVKLVSFLLE